LDREVTRAMVASTSMNSLPAYRTAENTVMMPPVTDLRPMRPRMNRKAMQTAGVSFFEDHHCQDNDDAYEISVVERSQHYCGFYHNKSLLYLWNIIYDMGKCSPA
jgi:hypothetical protein